MSAEKDASVGSAVAFAEFELVGVDCGYVLKADPATYLANGVGFGFTKFVKRDQIKEYFDDQGDLNLKFTINVVTHVGVHESLKITYELPYRAQAATYEALQNNWQRNVTIKCPEGGLMTQKTLLQHQSPVFRRMFQRISLHATLCSLLLYRTGVRTTKI